MAIQILLKEKKLNIFQTKTFKEIIINSKIYISSHTVIEMNKFFFSNENEKLNARKNRIKLRKGWGFSWYNGHHLPTTRNEAHIG